MGRDGLDAGCGSEGEVVLEGISRFGKKCTVFLIALLFYRILGVQVAYFEPDTHLDSSSVSCAS